jgi:2-aminoethylphosphonate-pyruvate transaminase
MKVFKGNDQYSTLVLGGSGTAAIEAVISSAITNASKLLVVSNGYYGEKIAKIAQIHAIKTSALKYDWGEKIKQSDVEALLKNDRKIKFVAMVHNETSTCMLNDVRQIGDLTYKYKKTFIVDAVSSLGIEDLDVARDHIDFCIGTPNKCIESIPGLSFVCANKKKLANLKDVPRRTSYLDLYTYYLYEEGQGERSGTPFTPPVQSFFALNVALDLLLEEGIDNRRKRYRSLAQLIREGLKELGFELFLDLKCMCNSITSVLTPKNISYELLHDKLKEKGFIIYAGQGNIENKMFRIGNMGALTVADMNRFLESLKSILQELNESPNYSI